MNAEKNEYGQKEELDVADAPISDTKQEFEEVELAKDENNYTAAEERKLIRKV